MSNDLRCNAICLLHLQTWNKNSILMFLCNVHPHDDKTSDNDDNNNINKHLERSENIKLSDRIAAMQLKREKIRTEYLLSPQIGPKKRAFQINKRSSIIAIKFSYANVYHISKYFRNDAQNQMYSVSFMFHLFSSAPNGIYRIRSTALVFLLI